MNITITKSSNPKKKYTAIVEEDDKKKTIHFGASGYSDYTIHKDPSRKERYLKRHRKNENWDDPKSASFYATNLLWNKPSFQDSFKDLKQKFPSIQFELKL